MSRIKNLKLKRLASGVNAIPWRIGETKGGVKRIRVGLDRNMVCEARIDQQYRDIVKPIDSS